LAGTGLFQKTRQAYRLFYPLAAFHAALSIPLWVISYLGLADLGLSAQDHAHEMIFGFALAVMTGFLLNGVKKINLVVLATLWIAGRAALFFPDLPAWLTALLYISFPILLAVLAAVPLFKNAKSWRNLAFAPILTAFTIGETLFQLGQIGIWDLGEERGLIFGLNLICAMVYMMGGRVVTAVTNGAMQAFDDHLKPGAQSYWEEKGFFALLLLVLGDLSGVTFLSIAGGLILSFCLIMRLYHWQVFRLCRNPQCLWLHIGFAWLLIGIVLRTIGHIFDGPYSILGIHTITIAALGTLTLTIMCRTTQQRLRIKIHIPPALLWMLAFLSLCVVTRLLMEVVDTSPWALISATSYSIGFFLFFIWIIRQFIISNPR